MHNATNRKSVLFEVQFLWRVRSLGTIAYLGHTSSVCGTHYAADTTELNTKSALLNDTMY